MEEPAMPVGPFHHRSDTETMGATLRRYFRYFSHLFDYSPSDLVAFPVGCGPFCRLWHKKVIAISALIEISAMYVRIGQFRRQKFFASAVIAQSTM
jgi:hypothetical protein